MKDNMMIDMWKQVLLSQDYDATLRIIVRKAAEMAGCSRTCLIIMNENRTFIIKAGWPDGTHGIGQRVTPESGEGFMKKLVREGFLVMVSKPATDKRTAYMRDFVKNHGISTVLFCPLTYKGEALGIMVFDAVDKERFVLGGREAIKMLIDFAATVLASERLRKKREDALMKKEKAYESLKISNNIAHTIRNSLSLLIGAYARRIATLIEMTTNREQDDIDKCLLDIKNCTGIIVSEVEKMEILLNDTLTKPLSPRPEIGNINEFIRKEAAEQPFKNVSVRLELDARLNRVSVCFDKGLLSSAICHIMENAVEAAATDISIKTKLKPTGNSFVLSLSNNGAAISPNFLPHIFEPFIMGEEGRRGLAKVKKIIDALGGHIAVHSSSMVTRIIITLPIQHAVRH